MACTLLLQIDNKSLKIDLFSIHHHSAASKQKKLEKFVKSKFVKNLVKMTTAARPTFDTARGGSGQRERDLSALSKQYSSRDL